MSESAITMYGADFVTVSFVKNRTDVEMARAVKGLDLIVGGHSQNPVCMSAENKPILDAQLKALDAELGRAR